MKDLRLRYAVVAVLAIVALVLAGKRLLYPRVIPRASTTTLGAAQSYLVILGVNDTAPTNWDGSLTVTGANIQIARGWRFSGTDSLNTASNTTTWKISTRTTPSLNPPGPVQENGLILKISVPTGPVTVDVTTPQGNFSFSTQDLPFGTSQTFLNGKALVAQTGAQFQLTNATEQDEDFPPMAQSNDDVYLAYTEFVHGDPSLAQAGSTSQPITDFGFLARPAGGDQVFLMHYSISQRTWTGPFAVTNPGEDAMRAAVAVDGQGRAWVIYSARRNNNFDLYARRARADGTMSSEIRLTTDPGTDIFPVATTDAGGRVWVAWQGFRNNNLEILTSVQNGDAFWPETIVSTSPASDWDAAIAAAPNGDVAISWDTYDKGDYDVYVRRAHFTNQVGFDPPIAIAATVNFEARSSLAYDSQNRLWIAYEVSGPKWGKDYGAYDTTGIGIYQNH